LADFLDPAMAVKARKMPGMAIKKLRDFMKYPSRVVD
jgi:hypothetical protein